mgnify:CR=1 FL=1
MGSISLQNVKKSFGEVEIIPNISLDIKEGEFSAHLMRPLSYFWLNAGRNMAVGMKQDLEARAAAVRQLPHGRFRATPLRGVHRAAAGIDPQPGRAVDEQVGDLDRGVIHHVLKLDPWAGPVNPVGARRSGQRAVEVPLQRLCGRGRRSHRATPLPRSNPRDAPLGFAADGGPPLTAPASPPPTRAPTPALRERSPPPRARRGESHRPRRCRPVNPGRAVASAA